MLRLAKRIAILIIIEAVLIAGSFSYLAALATGNVFLGNSINLAGKNRFLTASMLLEVESYLSGGSDAGDVKQALQDLEANILVLKQGGELAGVRVNALEPEFEQDWQAVYDDWLAYEAQVQSVLSGSPGTTELEFAAENLIASSDALVTKLGEHAKDRSDQMTALQVALGAVIIGVLMLMLLLILRIIKPVGMLGKAAAGAKGGHLDLSAVRAGSDEIGDLADSFNSIVKSLKESTSMLEASEKRYQDLYESAPDLYRSENPDGMILDCNRAYVKNLGYQSKGEVIGHSIFEHAAESSLDDMRRCFEDWKSAGDVANRQVWMKRKDGSIFPASISAASIYDNQTGKLVSSNTVIIDESDQYRTRKALEQANEELKRVNAMKDEFINIAAHELRTPVVPIILNAENLAEEMDDERVNAILRNAKKMTSLANDILDASRVESGNFRLVKEKTSIAGLVKESIQDVKVRIPEGKQLEVVLENRLAAGDENITLDKVRIGQVLANMLNNAVNFTEAGKIAVGIEKVSRMVQVSITDMGKGIDPEIAGRLFQKFATKSDRAKGTGLGLYLCKAIVEAHGGSVWAENNKGGKGATFAFLLPAS